MAPSPVFAQSVPSIDAPADARMMLTANELIYNNDTEKVIATGGVQIDYSGYNLVADRVEYDQQTGRMRAYGRVQILEPDGNKISADEIDITDDFADGFVNALQIVTPDDTRIAAESAERRGGVETTFNNGVYTACEPCKEHPEKAPIWQVKAEKVVQDERTRTVKLRNARFELFGMPIAYLPYLEVPDFDRKRKSGFLTPSFGSDDALGTWARVPYFLTLGQSADVTIEASGYTNQGFLLDTEFRKRFENGIVTLRAAGISQTGQDEFDPVTAAVDRAAEERGLIGTTGDFKINPRWAFGWKVMWESDPAFAQTYAIDGFDDDRQKSEIYLTGLGKRNYFDARAFWVDIRDGRIYDGSVTSYGTDNSYLGRDMADFREDREARVHPVIDYNKIFSQPVAGGELSLDVNGQSISRKREYVVDDIYRGIEGSNERATAELEWKRTLTTEGGLRLTPILAARGDLNHFDTTSTADTLSDSNSAARAMLTAGLEASYPLLVTAHSSSHVIEPIAQVFVRNDERLAGGLPNEDAQSFVFDATSLFERDKFSGYDRIEGGTRANLGFRYTGTFDNGVTTHGLFGQSYQLAGLNSFAVDSLTYAGNNSGLEEDASDFVGYAGIELPVGVGFSASARFDKDDFNVERADLTAMFTHEKLSGAITYSDINAQRPAGSPGYGSEVDRSGINGSLSLRFAENWRVFGASGYDLVDNRFSTSSVGVAYEDECVALTIVYKRKPSYVSDPKKWSIGARLSLRTLGDLDYGDATGKTF
ncbi:LPS-assembly protein LptD [Pseudohoeflea suaedae]|uniref:LPS-assembly protein LptD n=1 Tax=Pseudohoeflea suaedae TaxID=877384 RepID=A0A4R5PQD3_9HYPH|nr:LPS-assembly protein LptD [Pseudohoeflea suaedae]TDH38891.1 LPS-assembly protein LptD [Pseudohoeflea suaedae]